MRRPVHSTPNPMVMSAIIFEPNGRKAVAEAMGADPSSIAKAISEHKDITPMERNHIRQKVRKGLQVMQDRTIDNLDFMQLHIGARRVRLKKID